MGKLTHADLVILDTYACAIASALITKGASSEKVAEESFRIAKEMFKVRSKILAELKSEPDPIGTVTP